MSSSFPSTKLELFAHSAGRNEAFDERVLHINSGIYNIVTSLLAQHGKVVAHFVAKLDALLRAVVAEFCHTFDHSHDLLADTLFVVGD